MSKFNKLRDEIKTKLEMYFPSCAVRSFSKAYGGGESNQYGFLNLEEISPTDEMSDVYRANGYEINESEITFVCPLTKIKTLTMKILVVYGDKYLTHKEGGRYVWLRLGEPAA